MGCDCDRYIEVWNDVFSQFDNDGKGNYTELKQKNIDTGMGLERLAVVVQDVDSIFDIDTMAALTNRVGEIAGIPYKSDENADISIRIITDHIRSVTFMISDGIMPSNVSRGYVLRRLLRRAARHGRLLGIQGAFLTELAKVVIETSRDGYPELEEKKQMILSVIAEEEKKFDRTIDTGLELLNEEIETLKKEGKTVLPGEDAFRLYDTYGFPTDLTEEILEEQGMSYDQEGFDAAMQRQKEQARGSRSKTNYMGRAASIYDEIDPALTSTFTGYDRLEDTDSLAVVILKDGDEDYGSSSETIEEGQKGTLITKKSPFYGTMGGQEGDIGIIESPNGVFEVTEAIHLQGGKIGHVGRMISGVLTENEQVSLKVDPKNRMETCRNHSATHLLQKALREVLGTHVEQAGSLNNAARLRFDFTHFQGMSEEELKKTEELVNQKIMEALPVVTEEMPIDEARKRGAMALFGEKYGDVVRVVSMGDFSTELCGGTHVKNTNEIGSFKIISEGGISAGVRRIEAITAANVTAYYKKLEEELRAAAKAAKCAPDALSAKIASMQDEIKSLGSEVEKLKAKLANSSLGDILNTVKDVNGVKVLCAKVPDADMNGLRNLSDQLKEKLGECLILLASAADGKVSLVSMATDGAIAKGAHAGNLIKECAALVGGGGGGRPNMAQAGGKNPAGIDACVAKGLEVAGGMLA